ncbi:MCE family protein [Nocardioides sp. R-C-SC26]|uniref:MCE family protein n=1 Tax=Nocardioides sp. R-C-SC26 TaxID=2870414 RepID=UPI001E33800A|nr:MlaD family protein [Nocardioides sp. R-C-SC26]
MTGLRSIAVKFALFALVSLLLAMLLLNTMRNGLPDSGREFRAEFTDVSGLRVGDDVKVAGVRVGRVTGIEVTEEGADVAFELADQQPLLDSTRLVMRYQNLLGQRYLSLVQGEDRGAELEAGATLPTERTDAGFDLTVLLNGFRPLFEVLQPDDVNRLATSIVQVLQGEGGTVESLLQETTQLTTFLAERDDLFGDVIDNLVPVLDNLSDQDGEITSTVQELRALMDGLARDRQSIGDSIDGVSQLVGATSDFLAEVRRPTVATLGELREVAAIASDSRQRLNQALRGFGQVFEALGRSGSYESALNVYPCSFLLVLGSRIVNPAGNPRYSEVCS